MVNNQLRKLINSKIDAKLILNKLGLQFKINGEELVTKCQFHVEKTPSCFINAKKNLFHCFACGAAGDLVYFISHVKKIPIDLVISEYSSEVKFPKTLIEYEQYLNIVEGPIDLDKQYISDLQYLLEAKYYLLKMYYDKMKKLEVFSEYEIKYFKLETEIFNLESEIECCRANYFEKTHPPKLER